MEIDATLDKASDVLKEIQKPVILLFVSLSKKQRMRQILKNSSF